MTRSLRSELGRYATSVELVRAELGLDRPVSLPALFDEFAKPHALDAPIVTPNGTALGGHHWLELARDGRYRYRGYMRASGWPSFTYVVAPTVTGPGGPPAAMLAQGTAHGSNEPGNEESSWEQRGTNRLVAEHWLAFRRAGWTWDVRWNSDWIGVLDDWVAGILSATAVFGTPVGIAIVLGSRLADALDEPGLAMAGLAGVLVAGGGVLVFGPGALAPAVVAGLAAGAAVAAAVEHQPPTEAQKAFADQVFRGSIDWSQVELTNLIGIGRRPFVMPTGSRKLLVNLGAGYDDPITYTGYGDADTDGSKKKRGAGHLFIHELTHVWQIQHGGFLPGWLCDAAEAQSKGSSAYKYSGPGLDWHEYNIEQQADIVAEWFTGRNPGQPSTRMEQSDANGYWRYIRDNIRGGVT